MATLIYTFSDLYNAVSKFLGTYGSSGPTGDELTDAKEVVHDAYRRFLAADGHHVWSFLKPEYLINTISGSWEYELPDNFGELISDLVFGGNETYPPMIQCSVEQIRKLRSINTYNTYPQHFALVPMEYSPEIGTQWKLIMYPTPDATYPLYFRYRVNPKKLEADEDLPIGGVDNAHVLKQLCLAEAESSKEESSGLQEQKASAIFAAAINKDRRINTNNLGFNGDANIHTQSPWDIARGYYRMNDVNFNTD